MTGRPSTPDVVAHQVGELVSVVERLRGDLADMREEATGRESRDVERERARVEREGTRERHDTERHKALDERLIALDARVKPLEKAHDAGSFLRTAMAVAGGAIVTGIVVALLRVLGLH